MTQQSKATAPNLLAAMVLAAIRPRRTATTVTVARTPAATTGKSRSWRPQFSGRSGRTAGRMDHSGLDHSGHDGRRQKVPAWRHSPALMPRALMRPDLLDAASKRPNVRGNQHRREPERGVQKVCRVGPLPIRAAYNLTFSIHRTQSPGRNDPPTLRQRPIDGHARWAWCRSTCLLPESTPRALAESATIWASRRLGRPVSRRAYKRDAPRRPRHSPATFHLYP